MTDTSEVTKRNGRKARGDEVVGQIGSAHDRLGKLAGYFKRFEGVELAQDAVMSLMEASAALSEALTYAVELANSGLKPTGKPKKKSKFKGIQVGDQVEVRQKYKEQYGPLGQEIFTVTSINGSVRTTSSDGTNFGFVRGHIKPAGTEDPKRAPRQPRAVTA